jgi:guanylate kinase
VIANDCAADRRPSSEVSGDAVGASEVTTSAPGVLFIVASPSGGGKTTLVREVIDRLAERGIPAHFSVSHTTRIRRPAEIDGIDYHFVDRPTFQKMSEQRAFLEWAEYNDNLYGTARSEVEPRLAAGDHVFLDIEVQGASQVKTLIPDVVKIFVYPPSYEVLKARLMQRRQDPPDAIRRRLRWAMREFSAAGEFDYAIINDRLDEAVEQLFGVCVAERQRPAKMKARLDAIREAYQIALTKDSP